MPHHASAQGVILKNGRSLTWRSNQIRGLRLRLSIFCCMSHVRCTPHRLLILVTLSVILRAFAVEPNPLTAPLASEHPLYLDTSAPFDLRVADLVSRMTLEEKGIALNHNGPSLERFGLRSDKWNQCLHGVWWTEPTTLFPVPIAQAATWDTNLIHEMAVAISDEARAIYNGWHRDRNFKGEHKGLIYRSPVINISRNPYWGRINECFGEDPFLTGRMAVSFVTGIQGDDARYLKLASTLKHFAVNNVEKDRQKLDARVSERMLQEYWLPHFHDAVVEGKAQSLMASYNAINGTPNNINHWLLTDLLKNEWCHEGFVVSDLGGVNTLVNGHFGRQITFTDAVAQSLMAGCDFSDKEFMDNIPAAVREGKLSEERLNDAVRRVMRVRMRLTASLRRSSLSLPSRTAAGMLSMNSLSEKSQPAMSDCATASVKVICLPKWPFTIVFTPPRSETTKPSWRHSFLRTSVSSQWLMLFGVPLMALYEAMSDCALPSTTASWKCGSQYS